MAVRSRKNLLITSLKVKALATRMDAKEVETFERMYRQARSEAEQDQVTAAVDHHMNGWKTGTDAYSRILQAQEGRDFLGDDDDEEEDSPALKAARVNVRSAV